MPGIMKMKKYDTLPLGAVIGVFAPVIGFILYGFFWSYYFGKTLSYFINDIFLGVPTFQSSILTLSLIINLVPFFIFIRTERYKSARGVLLAIFIYVPVVLYLRFYNS